MKQQSCPRLHQKQSEDLKSKIFLGEGCPQTTLVGRHTYLCATCYYHPTTTLFPTQLKIIPLPPSSPPNSKSSRYHPLSPQLKIILLPPSSPPQLKILQRSNHPNRCSQRSKMAQNRWSTFRSQCGTDPDYSAAIRSELEWIAAILCG